MTTRYDESAHIAKLAAIEESYTQAVKLAVAQGKTFWSVHNDRGIGIGEALTNAGIAFNGISELHCGIMMGMYASHTNNPHADHQAGVRIGQRLRKLAFT